jgi:hypothetical protein
MYIVEMNSGNSNSSNSSNSRSSRSSSSNSSSNNSNSSNDDDLSERFEHMLVRLTNKMLANGVRSTDAFIDRADELMNFIDAGNPDAPFDFFSAEDLGAELYNEVYDITREVIARFPINRDRAVFLQKIIYFFNDAVTAYNRNHPGNMQNGGRRRKSRRAVRGRKQRKTRRSRR